jgi:N-acetylglucosamine-6-phosphate deacetylase
MRDAVRTMRRHTDISPRGVMQVTSHNPASVLSLSNRGNLLPGSHADLLLIDRQLELKAVFVGGREIE